MVLTDEERRMLAGGYGLGIQRAMDLFVKLGDSFRCGKIGFHYVRAYQLRLLS